METEEVQRIKEYPTMNSFMAAVRYALIKVFGHTDDLTREEDGLTLLKRIRRGENVIHNEGVKEEYKLGWDIEYPDRIYIFYHLLNVKEVR